MARKATGRPPGRPQYPDILTPAEQRVLEHVREGLRNAEIGVRLGISPDGVKYHVSNMLAKLGLKDREELAKWQPRAAVGGRWSVVPLAWKLIVGVALGTAGVAAAVVLVAAFQSDEPPALLDLPNGVVSVGMDGQPGNGDSFVSSISGDGRFVAFESTADNLVPGDSNGVADVFVRDRLQGTTVRVSVGPNGEQANGSSSNPVISRDGTHVAFESLATNLVPGTAVGRDESLAALTEELRATVGKTTAVTTTTLQSNVYARDLHADRVELVSLALDGRAGNLGSANPSISRDGRFVAFDSAATNLVPGDTNSGKGGFNCPVLFGGISGCDVFVRDLQQSRITRVSVANGGAEAAGSSSGAAISGNGRFVAFISDVGDLAIPEIGVRHLYVRDLARGTTRNIPMDMSASNAQLFGIGTPAFSDDGSRLAVITRFARFPGRPPPGVTSIDGNSEMNVWLYETATGKLRVAATGEAGGSDVLMRVSLSADGTITARTGPVSSAPLMLKIDDLAKGRTVDVVPAVDIAPGTLPFLPAISGDGRYVAYTAQVDAHRQIVVQRR